MTKKAKHIINIAPLIFDFIDILFLMHKVKTTFTHPHNHPYLQQLLIGGGSKLQHPEGSNKSIIELYPSSLQMYTSLTYCTLSVSQKAASGLEVPSFDTNFRPHKSLARSGSCGKGKMS